MIYGGIDTNRFRPFDAFAQRKLWGLNHDNFAFGVAGAYHLPRGKGQREFLLAVSKIHTQIPDARFLIIGRGSMAELLHADITRLGLRAPSSAILRDMDDDRPPICPACGVTMVPAELSAQKARAGEWICLECEETAEPIGLKRLEARPIATMSIEAQERHERMERVHRDD